MARKTQSQEALEVSKEAIAAIRAHEKLCDERWNEQRKWTQEIASKLEKLTDATQSGFDRTREIIGTKVTEVHDRVDALEKEGKNDAKAEARSANERFWALFWKILALGGVGAGGFFGGKHL